MSAGCSSVLYYPDRVLYTDPSKLVVQPKDILFRSKDSKTQLHGWMFEVSKRKAKAVFVLFHGNAENLSSHFHSMKWVLDHEYHLFAFSYRGYGRSEGEPDPKGTIEDGMAALEWAHHNYPDLPIIVIGQSLGGAIAFRSVTDLESPSWIQLVLLESTFSSYQSMGVETLSRSWATWLFQPLAYLVLSDKYAPEARIHSLKTPVIIIHGTHDRIVPFRMGEEFYKQVSEPKEFWELKDVGHVQAFFDDQTQARLLKKLAGLKRDTEKIKKP